MAASGSMDGQIKLWDLKTNQLRQTCEGHGDGIVKLKWHPTDALLYSCSVDRTIRLWDARTVSCVRTWHGHQDIVLDFDLSAYVKPICFSSSFLIDGCDHMCRDCKTIVSCSDDQTALVFRLDELEGN